MVKLTLIPTGQVRILHVDSVRTGRSVDSQEILITGTGTLRNLMMR